MHGRALGVRDGDWKLTACERDGNIEYELFNIADDPYEQHELTDEYPEKVKQLGAMIAEERMLDNSSARGDGDAPMGS